MRYEDLKIHIAEVERCQEHTQTNSVPPVLFPENLRKWNPATQTQRSPTREHQEQHRHPHLRCLPFPRTFISFAMISNNKLFQNFTRIPGVSSPISIRNFFQGHKEVDGNGKMSSGRTYNGLRIGLRWSDLLMHGIATLHYQLVIYMTINHLILTNYKFDEFVCQQWRQDDISRNRWGTKLKLSSFQNFAFLDFCTQ